MVGPAMGRWYIVLLANLHLSGWHIHDNIVRILKAGASSLPKAHGWAKWCGMT